MRKCSIVPAVPAVVALLFLSGCAVAPAPDPAVELALAGAIEECFESHGLVESARIAKLSDPKDILLDRAIAGLAVAAGGSKNPCPVTTNNDLQRVAMEENTKQVVAGIAGAESAAGSIVTGVLGWKALDIVPDLLGSGGGTYNLTSKGNMTLTDSLKTSSLGDITGTNALGGILNPATAKPFVVEVPGE